MIGISVSGSHEFPEMPDARIVWVPEGGELPLGYPVILYRARRPRSYASVLLVQKGPDCNFCGGMWDEMGYCGCSDK